MTLLEVTNETGVDWIPAYVEYRKKGGRDDKMVDDNTPLGSSLGPPRWRGNPGVIIPFSLRMVALPKCSIDASHWIAASDL